MKHLLKLWLNECAIYCIWVYEYTIYYTGHFANSLKIWAFDHVKNFVMESWYGEQMEEAEKYEFWFFSTVYHWVEQCFGSKWALSGQFAGYSYRWLQMAEHIQLLRLPKNHILGHQSEYHKSQRLCICETFSWPHLQNCRFVCQWQDNV